LQLVSLLKNFSGCFSPETLNGSRVTHLPEYSLPSPCQKKRTGEEMKTLILAIIVLSANTAFAEGRTSGDPHSQYPNTHGVTCPDGTLVSGGYASCVGHGVGWCSDGSLSASCSESTTSSSSSSSSYVPSYTSKIEIACEALSDNSFGLKLKASLEFVDESDAISGAYIYLKNKYGFNEGSYSLSGRDNSPIFGKYPEYHLRGTSAKLSIRFINLNGYSSTNNQDWVLTYNQASRSLAVVRKLPVQETIQYRCVEL
jgi:hypothetical protein